MKEITIRGDNMPAGKINTRELDIALRVLGSTGFTYVAQSRQGGAHSIVVYARPDADTAAILEAVRTHNPARDDDEQFQADQAERENQRIQNSPAFQELLSELRATRDRVAANEQKVEANRAKIDALERGRP